MRSQDEIPLAQAYTTRDQRLRIRHTHSVIGNQTILLTAFKQLAEFAGELASAETAVAVEAAYQNASIQALRILLPVCQEATGLSLWIGLVAELA